MTEAVSQDRTKNYFRQVKGSVLFKGLAVAASFFAVPLMIRYLGQEQYGVWSTLLSIMSWVVFFDLGIGNGLRNKLAESLAKNQPAEAAGYISSGYTWIGAISFILFVLVATASFLIPWQSVFNTKIVSDTVLRNTVLIAAFFVFLNFWLGLINQVLNAVQKTSTVVLGQFISNALGLLIVFVLTKITDASLLYLVTGYGISIVAASIFLSVWFYKSRVELVPKLSFERKHIHPLLAVGMQFFVIQLAVLVIFTTDKMLITQLFGPLYVTQYDVVFKLFSVITLLHGLMTAPLWSAYTDAYHRSDLNWIKQTLHKQLWVFMGIVLATVMFGFLAKSIIKLWVGSDVDISSSLVFSMGIFVVISAWNNIFAFLLNGVQKIKLSLLVSVVAMIANIPISIFIANSTSFGVASVLIGTVIVLLPGVFLGPYQVYKIINKRDVGIWSR